MSCAGRTTPRRSPSGDHGTFLAPRVAVNKHIVQSVFSVQLVNAVARLEGKAARLEMKVEGLQPLASESSGNMYVFSFLLTRL